ncbi:MFS transporter [Oxalobacteraceae bacterium OTU3CAMAD1]|nr:MFS transporter [Oxalobacteraceae bacterium OTU3CAMAD1]
MIKTDSFTGRCVLMVAHCAGMLDLVALPVWVGTLISKYGLDPQQAGGLATLFLVGAVLSSLFFAPRLSRYNGRLAATCGFGLTVLSFLALSMTRDYTVMMALHALAGASAGCALSFTHGTIGRSADPHRLFALVGVAIGFFALAFFAVAPQLVANFGGGALFQLFAAIMAVATLATAVGFPQSPPSVKLSGHVPAAGRLDPAVWCVVFGIGCLALVQSMTFSFVERIGIDHGFGFAAVSGVLIAVGLVNLVPAPMAVLLQRRLSANRVMLAGPVVQAAIVMTITHSATFPFYAVATSMLVGVLIFTHTFAFGAIAALDPSGRAAAATPATLMTGAAIGPLLGGTLVKTAGYGSIGIAAVVLAVLAVISFRRAQSRPILVPSL